VAIGAVSLMPTIRSYHQAKAMIDALDYSEPLSFEVERLSQKRSLPQNNKSHVWYNQVDKQLCLPIGTTRCECKLYFGIPMLKAEDQDFAARYDGLIKDRFTKEEKLELMRWFPVTSLMTKSQKSRYLETIQAYYADGMGIILD